MSCPAGAQPHYAPSYPPGDRGTRGGRGRTMTTNGTAAGTWPTDSTQRWAQGWRRFALASGMLIYPVATAGAVPQHSHGAGAVIGLLIVAAFCACYALAALAATHLAWRRVWWLLGAMTVLFLAELPFAQTESFFLGAVVVA